LAVQSVLVNTNEGWIQGEKVLPADLLLGRVLAGTIYGFLLISFGLFIFPNWGLTGALVRVVGVIILAVPLFAFQVSIERSKKPNEIRVLDSGLQVRTFTVASTRTFRITPEGFRLGGVRIAEQGPSGWGALVTPKMKVLARLSPNQVEAARAAILAWVQSGTQPSRSLQ
jgi:hypothetical protein